MIMLGKTNTSDKNVTNEVKSNNNIFVNYLTNTGLYDEIEITQDNIYELTNLIGGHIKIDIYCPKCGENRVFYSKDIKFYSYDSNQKKINEFSLEKEIIGTNDFYNMCNMNQISEEKEPWYWTNDLTKEVARLMVFSFTCAMDNTHHQDYIVVTSKNRMIKIGQFPSFADLSFPELKEYKKVMDKDDEKEFKRAIGLYANGIGVGSFVYLRRIFERIINKAKIYAIKDGITIDDTFNKLPIREQIKGLANYLPITLVQNTVFYPIVSKGIHELTEDECLKYFPILKSFIIMILRQWEKLRKDKDDEKQISNLLENIAQHLK